MIILELTRRDLVARTRSQSPDRFTKRLNYKPSEFKGIDTNSLFKDGELVFTTPINGYLVTIAFDGVIDELKRELAPDKPVNLQTVIRALSRAYDNSHDVKVNCTCPDFTYRHAYYATKDGYKYGDPQSTPPKVTNPDNNKGSTCKHITSLLNNKQWIVKVASVVNTYIKTYYDQVSQYLYDVDPMKADEESPELAVDDETTGTETPEVNDLIDDPVSDGGI